MSKIEMSNSAQQSHSEALHTGMQMLVDAMRDNDGRANTALLDLYDHGLIKRRDATGITEAEFEEAKRLLEAGEHSHQFPKIGNNVLDMLNGDDSGKMAKNFIFELHQYRGADYLTATERRVVASVLESDLNDPDVIGRYAIVRAMVRERYIQQEFGEVFTDARRDTAAFLDHTLTAFGLDKEDVRSAVKRVEKTKLAAQDYLDKPVTGSQQEGYRLFGDYASGSLQAHVYLEPLGGGRMRTPNRKVARKTMIHELIHAGSVQPVEAIETEGGLPRFVTHRTGLAAHFVFVPPNEGLTELFARQANGEQIISNEHRPYDKEVLAVAQMAQENPYLFGVLVHSAFGSQLHDDLPAAFSQFSENMVAA